MSNVTFRAGVSWSGPGDPSVDVVLRLPDRDAPAHDRIVCEHRAQALLRNAGLPVPEPAWTGFDDPVLSQDFYVMQLVPGRSTTDNPPYHQAGWLRDAGPAVQAAVWDEALSHLSMLHRVDWREGGLGFLAEELPGSERPLTDALVGRAGWRFDAALARPALVELLVRRADMHGHAGLGSISIGEPALDLAALVWTDEQEQSLAGDRLPDITSEYETVSRYQDLLGQPMVNYPYYKILYAVPSASWPLLVHGRLVVRGALQGVEDVQEVPEETLEAIEDMIDRL
jgi:aminoglycoside phosphotransferase (APT) family kinase protein